MGSCWDVTELTEAAKSRERLLSLLQATVEATTDGTLVVDRERKVAVRNRRFLDLWRIPPSLAQCQDATALLGYVRNQLENPERFVREVEEIYGRPEAESTSQIRCATAGSSSAIRYRSGSGMPWSAGSGASATSPSGSDFCTARCFFRMRRACSPRWRWSRHWTVSHESPSPIWAMGAPSTCSARAAPGRLVAISRDPRTPISPELHPSILSGHSLVYQVGPISYLGVPLLMKDSLVGAITFSAAAHRRYQPHDIEVAEELGPARRPRAGQREALPTSAGSVARPRRVSLRGGARNSRPAHRDSPGGAGDPKREGTA